MPNISKFPDAYDRIEAYYTGNKKLSELDKRIAERWELAFLLLQKERNRKIAVSKLISIESRKGRKLSTAQAYADMISAEKLFLPIMDYSKDLLRHVMIESAQRDLKNLEERMRKEIGTTAQWIKLMELKHKTESRLIELAGIDKDNPDLPDFSKLELARIEVNVPNHVMQIMDKLMETGVVDITKMMEQSAVDIDYEETPADDSEEEDSH
jgi:hypothetical protein